MGNPIQEGAIGDAALWAQRGSWTNNDRIRFDNVTWRIDGATASEDAVRALVGCPRKHLGVRPAAPQFKLGAGYRHDAGRIYRPDGLMQYFDRVYSVENGSLQLVDAPLDRALYERYLAFSAAEQAHFKAMAAWLAESDRKDCILCFLGIADIHAATRNAQRRIGYR